MRQGKVYMHVKVLPAYLLVTRGIRFSETGGVRSLGNTLRCNSTYHDLVNYGVGGGSVFNKLDRQLVTQFVVLFKPGLVEAGMV